MRRIDNYTEYYPKTGDLIWVNLTSSYARLNNRLAGSLDKDGYRVISFKKNNKTVRVRVHHIAWYKIHGVWPPRPIDHRFGNKLDHRPNKIRLIGIAQNLRNHKLSRLNTTGYSGVVKRGNKYEAKIHKRRDIYLGRFPTLKEAIHARRAAEIKYFGKYRYRG